MNKSGYQIQKERVDQLLQRQEELRQIVFNYEEALKEIARLKGPEVIHAPGMATKVLLENM